MKLDWIKTKVARIALRPDEIIWVEITPGADQAVEDAQENLRVCKSLRGDTR